MSIAFEQLAIRRKQKTSSVNFHRILVENLKVY